jgi:hypothetical protein
MSKKMYFSSLKIKSPPPPPISEKKKKYKFLKMSFKVFKNFKFDFLYSFSKLTKFEDYENKSCENIFKVL